jgi:hypothetical protein
MCIELLSPKVDFVFKMYYNQIINKKENRYKYGQNTRKFNFKG